MENREPNQPDLNAIVESIKKIETQLAAPKKDIKVYLPLIIALIGVFGSIIGYFVNQSLQAKLEASKAEIAFISKAFENGKSGREKLFNLKLVLNSDLIPSNRERIEEMVNEAVILEDGDMVFLNNYKTTYDAMLLYEMGYNMKAEGTENNSYNRQSTAIRLLRRSIELDSTYYPAHTLLGYCLNGIEKYKEAEAAYTNAIGMNARYKGIAYYNRGFSNKMLGNRDQAIQDLTTAKELATQINDREVLDNVDEQLDLANHM
jgi:tetratricopeptide (TPR) repeat protein